MNRRSFIGGAFGALVATALPARAIASSAVPESLTGRMARLAHERVDGETAMTEALNRVVAVRAIRDTHFVVSRAYWEGTFDLKAGETIVDVHAVYLDDHRVDHAELAYSVFLREGVFDRALPDPRQPDAVNQARAVSQTALLRLSLPLPDVELVESSM